MAILNSNSCSNSSVLHPLSLLRTEQRIFRAEQGISCAEQGVCNLSGQFHRIALQLHDQDGVAILRGRRSFAESRPSGGDRRASVSAAACPREPRRRNEHNATTLVRREPASGSGFNLVRIAAYSYIVNLISHTAEWLCPGYRRRDAEKRRRVLFHLHVVSVPQRLRQISALHSRGGVRLLRSTGCAGDMPSTWAAGLSLTRCRSHFCNAAQV